MNSVKIDKYFLTSPDKMGYNYVMLTNIISFFIRMILIAALCVFIWGLIEPKTQLARVFRAALLMLGMLAILAVVRFTGL
jgi:hypothetical protein